MVTQMAAAPAPTARVARRWLSGGAFTDAVGAHVSLDEMTQYTGGIGLSAETTRTLEDGTLALCASADVERALGGAETAAVVSGAPLAAHGPGSGDTEYPGRVSLGWTF